MKLLFFIFLLFTISINLKGQDECPIKIKYIDEIGNALTNRNKNQKFQICIKDDSIEIQLKSNELICKNNFHGTIGFCKEQLRFIDYCDCRNNDNIVKISIDKSKIWGLFKNEEIELYDL